MSNAQGHAGAASGRDVLLVNLGMGPDPTKEVPYQTTTYRFEAPDYGFSLAPEPSWEQTTWLAGLAVWRFLIEAQRAPVSVAFVATPEAWEQQRGRVREEMKNLELPDEILFGNIACELPRSLRSVWTLLPHLEAWLRAAPGSGPLTLHLDVTHGYRAIPIAQTWLVRFLVDRGLAGLGSVSYGAFVKGHEPTPMVNLGQVMQMADWGAGVRDFRERLDPSKLSSLLGPEARTGRRSAFESAGAGGAAVRAHEVLEKLVGAAAAAGCFFPAGLPLELGIAVGHAMAGIDRAAVAAASSTLFPEHASLFLELYDAIEPLACSRPAKRHAKQRLSLGVDELYRQRGLVEKWVATGALGNALRCLRELAINRVLLAWRCKPLQWLKRPSREAAARRLNALTLDPGRPLAPDENRLGALWSGIRDLRNSSAHCAMEESSVDPREGARRTRELLRAFDELSANPELWVLHGIAEADEAGHTEG